MLQCLSIVISNKGMDYHAMTNRSMNQSINKEKLKFVVPSNFFFSTRVTTNIAKYLLLPSKFCLSFEERMNHWYSFYTIRTYRSIFYVQYLAMSTTTTRRSTRETTKDYCCLFDVISPQHSSSFSSLNSNLQ